MKAVALIALIMTLLATFFSVAQYIMFLADIHNPIISKITWPISIFLHNIPVILLAVAILLHSNRQPYASARNMYSPPATPHQV